MSGRSVQLSERVPRYARDEYFRSERKTGKQTVCISLGGASVAFIFCSDRRRGLRNRRVGREGKGREGKGGGTKDIRAVELSSFIVRLRPTHQDLIFRSFFSFFFSISISVVGGIIA